ncbi:unnamed protein product [Linum tenue]|uniref:Uncharacterized protein n=1 Tax=Linum tenue TaxID=586396 RepID=A0AAV0PM42_9ROSI|nr:unnamed protein product [Linum tenue]
MSWFRSAVNRAVVAGGHSSLSRTVRTVADTVVVQAGNAVTGGAKIITDRIKQGSRNLQNFRQTAKRLEEVAVSYRGIERVQLMRRWLVALKEIERLSASFTADDNKSADENLFPDDSKESPKKPTMIYYFDPDLGTMNFRDVFLYSQALEGIALSMILEAPSVEEVSMLLEMFGLCLAGGKEVHQTLIDSIQTLAKAFSTYRDEVLVKREELLQLAKGAISGLKMNADLARIDAEVGRLLEKLEKQEELNNPSSRDSTEKSIKETTQDLKDTLKRIQLCSTLEALLIKKRSLTNGDSAQAHAEKVDKLKILAESLISSTKKAESRIVDHRCQKEEALNFRVAKTNEVSQIEKELAVEIKALEKQKHELESQLKRVNTDLTSARQRIHNAKEERENFDEASNQILMHLKSREEELSKSINSCRVEAEVVNSWIHFLQDTWVLQSAHTEQKEKQVNGDLERYGDYLENLVIHLLTAYKEQLGPAVTRFRGLVEELHLCHGPEAATPPDIDNPKRVNKRKGLEDEYLESEAKIITILSIVDTVKKQFNSKHEGIYRKDTDGTDELFNAIGKIKEEFESIVRPTLERRMSSPGARSLSPYDRRSHDATAPQTPRQSVSGDTPEKKEKKRRNSNGLPFVNVNGRRARDPRLQIELDHESDGRGNSPEDLGLWECDAGREIRLTG